MTCINVGDSRAMLGTFHNFTKTWKPIVLSRDHKPDIKTEHDRIEAAGGYVHFQKNSAGIRVNLNCSNILYLQIGPSRVYQDKSREMGGLAMSRSIGDTVLK